MESVFALHHVRVIEPGQEDVKLIGIYRSKASASMAVNRLKGLSGFRDDPAIVLDGCGDEAGFHISEYTLDAEGGWAEGFVYGDEA